MLEKFFNKRRIAKGFEIEDSIMTATEKEEGMMETRQERIIAEWFWRLMLILILILAGRVFYLGFIRGSYYADLSNGNRVRQIVIKASRGKILDKFGSVIVKNVPSTDAIIIPSDLPQESEERRNLAKISADVLGLNFEETAQLLENQDRKSLKPVLLKENITQDQALIISEKISGLKGIYIESSAIRSYENGPIFSTLIGYDGKITDKELEKNPDYLMTDYIGKTGLEKSYEKFLRGKHGARLVEVNARGDVQKNLGVLNPQAGSDLVLHVDEGLQKKLFDSISSALENGETKTASAVAINPQNGGILAMVSFPTFDNNLFAQGISQEDYQKLITDKDLPLFNRAVSGEYPPGSTIKPIIASGALQEGIITPQTIIDGLGGRLHIGAFSFGDWKVHGPSDVRKAIAESNDIFFYTIGGGYGNVSGLGMSRMKKYYNLFGLGEPTKIDVGGEASGFIPDEEWKLQKLKEKWYIGNSYHASIGQGYVLATPVQLASYTASIANRGVLYSPKIVSMIKKENGDEQKIEPEVIRKNFIAPDVLNVVREGMRQTVESGTAQSLKTLSVAVAGKTGTAQFGNEDKTHSWFVSFAPYDNPEIAMVVLVEGGGESHSSAVPISREVYDWYFNREKTNP